MKILLADDDRDLVDLLTFTLTRAGLAVVAAHEAPAALRLLAAERPAIAVLDVDLGRWSGLDLLRELRKASDIPVILSPACAPSGTGCGALSWGRTTTWSSRSATTSCSPASRRS